MQMCSSPSLISSNNRQEVSNEKQGWENPSFWVWGERLTETKSRKLRGHLAGIGYVLLPHGSWGELNSGYQPWWQALSPGKPSQWPSNPLLNSIINYYHTQNFACFNFVINSNHRHWSKNMLPCFFQKGRRIWRWKGTQSARAMSVYRLGKIE